MIPRYVVDFDLDKLPRVETDVIVIGAGIAGLFTALKASETKRVLMITKKSLFDSNTRYAQGGIAAVMSDDDSPEFLAQDTLIAGAGLCEASAVDVLVHEGPRGVQELIRYGTNFDEEDGQYALTKEGAHSQRRILHANGDATGYEIVRALVEKVKNNQAIELWEDHFVLDLLTEDEECRGALVQKPDGTRVAVFGLATILCTGGTGQLYRYTTNPEIATGDGVAIAYRAGADIRDMEFNQFHPTALCYPGAPRFLISEAVRGEGAYLRNIRGERFMENYHPQLELAPRDVVARAIINEMEATKSTYVYLDITHESPDLIRHRFPTIYEYCLNYGLDMTTDWIPVAPAAHYMMGGVKTDLHGETSIQRLFACGEASSTGVHGANRLASNSLSEAIVFGQRIVDKINELSPNRLAADYGPAGERDVVLTGTLIERRLKLQKSMVRYVGLRRDRSGLLKGLEDLKKQLPLFQMNLSKIEELEYANLLTCALLVAEGALNREESRGGHYREDYPERDDQNWRAHTIINRNKGIHTERVDDDV
ncbi:L-aspartate oxidase [Cohnella terricola]|uniref:L-aspartate oxidase n=1 Tax=Cohnella terricola TaxID=1289167 RepID=A0A559J7G9_9BACL|nr:L-aspartate oxidase [Cohnella terricola]TVX95813.1 L-aspartate oxidase [Cohnella terricola]